MSPPSPHGFGPNPGNPGLGDQAAGLASWFARAGRPLPWRGPPTAEPAPHAWGVLVSEFMLQQTPVDRVLPVWAVWMERWPTPADLAESPAADAIRAWGRLGYPRRALRLHAAATVIDREHGGLVPDDPDALRALPGVGDYTAGAILAFAYGRRALALDTNVRRVIARHDFGVDRPATSVTVGERQHAEASQPTDDGAQWMAALMELGALVCTARSPACDRCPVSTSCAWLARGRPAAEPVRRQPSYEGSDRQARGAIMAVLRQAKGPVTGRAIDLAWPDDQQRARALDGLVADGLVAPASRGRWQLPGQNS